MKVILKLFDDSIPVEQLFLVETDLSEKELSKSLIDMSIKWNELDYAWTYTELVERMEEDNILTIEEYDVYEFRV